MINLTRRNKRSSFRRNVPKTIDCFIFYNELDMLQYRLAILNNVVDYFVIVESTHTFIGKRKPLFFNENKHLFEKFNHKIIHIIVNDFPFKHNVKPSQVWENEFFQRNAISRGIDSMPLKLNDIIIISDVDEIPDTDTLCKLKNKSMDMYTLQMDFYYYNLNTKIKSHWNLCKVLSYKKYKELNISCNDIRNTKCPIIRKGGWHLSYFGDATFIKNKIKNFSHQELNTTDFTHVSNIEKRIKSHKDLYGRNIKITKINIKDNDYLPKEYDTYLTKFYV